MKGWAGPQPSILGISERAVLVPFATAFFTLGVMTLLYALFRDDDVFLQEHFGAQLFRNASIGLIEDARRAGT